MAILGIDEVGRGPWAGPLVIGAVILPTFPDNNRPDWYNELTDSKKLSAKKRESLNEIILKEAPATGLGWVSSQELDKIGLSNALKLAARRAVEEVQSKHVPFEQIIIDGTINFLAGTKLEKYVSILPKADFLVKEVSAASIIAKVARDQYMAELSQKYPQYSFEKHVGYGTAAHKKSLEAYGPCPEHRFSFRPVQEIAQIFAPNTGASIRVQPTTTEVGKHAEKMVADYLQLQNHKILARNYKTKTYEIDIISCDNEKIYFTEVKYRQNNIHGTPLAAITKTKQDQMSYAAQCFMHNNRNYQKLSPVLAVAAVSGDNYQIDDWFVIK